MAKPRSFFVKDKAWRGLDHDFPLSENMLLNTAGIVCAKPPAKLGADMGDMKVTKDGKTFLQRPQPCKMYADLARAAMSAPTRKAI